MDNAHRNNWLFATTAIGVALALGAHGIAGAAEASPPRATPIVQSTQPSGATSVGEVIVTASRFSQNLQKSSLAISAISGSELIAKGVSDTRDLTAVVPGVVIGQSGTNPNIYIRGAGSVVSTAFNESSAAFNLDAVNIARPPAQTGVFYDLDRVEVLKGPQGTLYGRNATAGAINVVTKNPVINGGYSGYAILGGGNYAAIESQAAVNLPLNDQLAARVAFQSSRHDGYLSDGADDEDLYAGRAKLLYTPNSDVSVLFSGDYAHLGGKGPGGVLLGLGGNRWTGAGDSRAQAVSSVVGGGLPNFAPLSLGTYVDTTSTGFSAQMDINLGAATLTFIPAVRNLHSRAYTNSTGFGNLDDNNEAQQSFEGRIAHSNSWLKWVVGGYYFNSDQNAVETGNLQPIIAVKYTIPNIGDKTSAAFGEATVSISTKIRLIGGLRYTVEDKSIAGSVVTTIFGTPQPATITGKKSYTNTSWKAGVEYDLAPQSMLYFTAATGFHSGGFYADTTGHNSYAPEMLTAYEFGSKNRFLNNALQVNLEAFYWDYSNRQIAHSAILYSGGPGQVITNAGHSKMRGVDVSVIFNATSADHFTANIEYNDTKYTKFNFDTPSNPAGSLSCPITPTAGGQFHVNCDGYRLERAPKWGGNVSYTHAIDLDDRGNIDAVGGIRFSSGYFLSSDFLPVEYQESYAVGDLDITYTPLARKWALTAYVHNIANTAVYSGGFQLPLGSHSFATIGAPRTYGARFLYNF